jgi:hypothetical protein
MKKERVRCAAAEAPPLSPMLETITISAGVASTGS